MSTRMSKTKTDSQSIEMGYEGSNTPEDFSIPSCTIEDVDRALFNLFNDEIPLYYTKKKDKKRIPVIFATGERFAVLRRNRPLRDKAGALILPLISIMRSNVSQDSTKGNAISQNLPLTIKKRLYKEDALYQNLINKKALKNQDNVASSENFSNSSRTRVKENKIATRRAETIPTLEVDQGKLLVPELNNENLYEVIQLPPTKYFTATYEITFWAQYTQQMNDMLSAMMMSYQENHKRTFRIETEKGYWFVAYCGDTFDSNTNFDDFSDNERIVKYSFSVEVPAYIVNPDYPGAPNGLRSYVSAPSISFDVYQAAGQMVLKQEAGPISSNLNNFILEPLDGEDDLFPATRLLGEKSSAASDARDITDGVDAPRTHSDAIGGAQAGKLTVSSPQLGVNPFTGEKYEVSLVQRVTTNKGETTYKNVSNGMRQTNIKNLGDLDI